MSDIDWENTEAMRTIVCMHQDDLPKHKLFIEYVVNQLEQHLDEHDLPEPCSAVAEALINFIGDQYKHEQFVVTPPPYKTYLSYTLEGAQYRDQLIALHRKVSNAEVTFHLFTKTLVSLLNAYIEPIPSLGDEGDTVPVTDLINVPALITEFLAILATDELATNDLFTSMRRQIAKNILEINPRRLIAPQELDGTPLEVAHAYFKHTPLEKLLTVSVPFQLSQDTRYAGHWIIAPSGFGKTTLLHSLFHEDSKREASIILMDSKGEFIDPIRKLRALKDRLVIIEPSEATPIALNPFDIRGMNTAHTIALLQYVVAGLMGAKFTELQQALFRNVIPAMLQAIPNPTIFSFRDVVLKGIPAEHMHKLDAYRKQFFEDKETGFYSSTYAETKKQVAWRLDDVLSNDLLRAMFSAPKTKLDINEMMDEGKIVVINNNYNVLSEMGVEIFSRFFVYLILSAAMRRSSRPQAQKLPCYVYIDECHLVIRNDHNITNIIDQCRSQNIALILSHQRLEQIKSKDVTSALRNCAIRMANSDDDAFELAPVLRTTPQHLSSLKRGQFAVWTRELGNSPAITLNIKKQTLGEAMTPDEQAALAMKMLAYCYLPEQPSEQPPEPQSQPPENPALKRPLWKK